MENSLNTIFWKQLKSLHKFSTFSINVSILIKIYLMSNEKKFHLKSFLFMLWFRRRRDGKKSADISTVKLFFSFLTSQAQLFRMIDNNFSSKKILALPFNSQRRRRKSCINIFNTLFHSFIFVYIFLNWIFLLSASACIHIIFHNIFLFRMPRFEKIKTAKLPNCLPGLVNIYLWWKSVKVINKI